MTHHNSALGLTLARTLLGTLFLVSGIGKIWRFAGIAGFMASKGLPAADLLLVATIVLEVACSLALIAGWHVRLSAWALAAFTALATLIFHAFWTADAASYQNQLNHFLKNLAIIGGLLCLAIAGAGAWSIEGRAKAKA